MTRNGHRIVIFEVTIRLGESDFSIVNQVFHEDRSPRDFNALVDIFLEGQNFVCTGFLADCHTKVQKCTKYKFWALIQSNLKSFHMRDCVSLKC